MLSRFGCCSISRMETNEIRDIVWAAVQELSSVEKFMRGDIRSAEKPLPALAINCLDAAESLLIRLRLAIVEAENR